MRQQSRSWRDVAWAFIVRRGTVANMISPFPTDISPSRQPPIGRREASCLRESKHLGQPTQGGNAVLIGQERNHVWHPVLRSPMPRRFRNTNTDDGTAEPVVPPNAMLNATCVAHVACKHLSCLAGTEDFCAIRIVDAHFPVLPAGFRRTMLAVLSMLAFSPLGVVPSSVHRVASSANASASSVCTAVVVTLVGSVHSEQSGVVRSYFLWPRAIWPGCVTKTAF